MESLDWCSPVPTALRTTGWDLILAADCVFWEHLFVPLLNTLAALSAVSPGDGRETRIFLTIGERLGRGPLKVFAQHATREGWSLDEIAPPADGRHVQDVVLCELRRPLKLQSS